MILKLSLIVFLVVVGLYAIRISYKSRSAELRDDQKALILKGVRTNVTPFLTFSIILLLHLTGDHNKDLTFLFITAFIIGILIKLIELTFQLLINRDRLLIGTDKLIFRGVNTIELDWDAINKIRLNGLTNMISIRGNRTIRFNKNRISRIDLDELFAEIENRTGFENIELTDNLKERKTAGNNVYKK